MTKRMIVSHAQALMAKPPLVASTAALGSWCTFGRYSTEAPSPPSKLLRH